MIEYIYKDGNKYFREVTDLAGIPVLKEEITKEEYDNYHT